MTLRSDLTPHVERRIALLRQPSRTPEEDAELERLTTLLAAALPVRNALAMDQDDRPTMPVLPDEDDGG